MIKTTKNRRIVYSKTIKGSITIINVLCRLRYQSSNRVSLYIRSASPLPPPRISFAPFVALRIPPSTTCRSVSSVMLHCSLQPRRITTSSQYVPTRPTFTPCPCPCPSPSRSPPPSPCSSVSFVPHPPIMPLLSSSYPYSRHRSDRTFTDHRYATEDLRILPVADDHQRSAAVQVRFKRHTLVLCIHSTTNFL